MIEKLFRYKSIALKENKKTLLRVHRAIKKHVIIFLEKNNETVEREFSGTAEELLEQLGVNPVTVIVAVDRKLVPLETDITGAKRVDVLTIVSGG